MINLPFFALRLISVMLVLLLVACQNDKVESVWEGQWQRTLTVPKNIQGRCVEEELFIYKKIWRSKVTLYPTFQCADPFLELVYEGVLYQVAIKKHNAQQIALHVRDITLAEMTDILGEERTTLKGPALKKLSSHAVVEQNKNYVQEVFLDKQKDLLQSSVYPPLLSLVSEQYPKKDVRLMYRRVY